MRQKQSCPPLSLTTQWDFWAWIYDLKSRQNKVQKEKQHD